MKAFLKTVLATIVGCFVALFICFFLFMGFIGTIAMLGSDDAAPVVPSEAILKIDFKNPISERANDDPFSGLSAMSLKPTAKSMGILQAVQAIEYAATDPSIKFIYLNLNTVNAGMSQLEEVRCALQKFRDSGKAIIAYANNYSQGAYYLATVADKIYIQKEGRAEIFGVGTKIMFFKDLLDRLGIEVQLIRHGKFKAAAEQFIANTISDANRKQNQEMIDSVWDSWATSISESREISVEQFNLLVDELKLGNAESLLAYNIVDKAVTQQEMSDILCDLSGVEDEDDLKTISLPNYAKAVIKPNIKAKEKIAVIYANGEIAMAGTEGITAAEFCSVIPKVREDSSIKAVVLRVNSPGGDAQAAEMINQELQLLREVKPVIVSFGDYAASGGYWISAKSDYIFTNNTTLTGSIGVFSLMMNYGKGLKKHLDVNTVTLGTNKHSDMFMGVEPLDAAEQAYMQDFVEEIYTDFTELVAEGRSLEVGYVDSIAQGRVWAGAEALNIKLADAVGGISDAIQYAATYIGAESYRIVEYPTVKSSMDKFIEMLGEGSVKSLLPEQYKAIENAYSYLKNEEATVCYARIPYIYEFKY